MSLFPPDELDNEPEESVLTVSELTQQVKVLLEAQFPSIWVSGEISNLSRPRSGHVYFDLKDEQSVIKSVIWRSAAARLKFELQDGQQVICKGALDVYPPHGSYKLIVRRIDPVGVGPLQIAFEKLFEKLTAEGLFDPQHKKPLPRFPSRIALVTSATGAAVHDFIQTASRRWPLARILVIPVKVQGPGSAQEIADAIELANLLRPKCDVIVAGRGGGSLEDLWSFNEETVVRAIFQSEIPVVSAVGHEVDVTLADLVADARALTPTAAAEIVLPSQIEMIDKVEQIGNRMVNSMKSRLEFSWQRWKAYRNHHALKSPIELIRRREQRLDEMAARFDRSITKKYVGLESQLSANAAKLNAVNPLAVLSRGFSVVQRGGSKQPIRDASQLSIGDEIDCLFHQGKVTATVDSTSNEHELEWKSSSTNEQDE